MKFKLIQTAKKNNNASSIVVVLLDCKRPLFALSNGFSYCTCMLALSEGQF
jgi:hypothetical protein